MGNFCYTALKYLLFFINILFLVAGLAIVAAGIYFRVTVNVSALNVFAYGVIILGCIAALISFSGCCGAVSEVRCLLITYSIIMLLLALANIALIVVVFNYNDLWQYKVEEIITSTFKEHLYEEPLRLIEAAMQCCGTTGPGSYPADLPLSCCQSSIEASSPTCALTEAFPKGCAKVVGDTLSVYAMNIAYSMIAMTMFEFMTVLSAVYLCRNINEKQIY